MSHFKRSVPSSPDLRPHKRARTFPVTQDEYRSRTPVGEGGWCKMCSHCTPTPAAYAKSESQKESEHERPETASQNSVAPPVGDMARVNASKRPIEQDHAPEEDTLAQEKPSYSHVRSSEDSINEPSPAKQGTEDRACPEAEPPSASSLVTHSKISSSTQTELTCHGSDPSVLVHDDPNTDTCMHCRQYWRAKPRPRRARPENPYRKGLTLKIHKHEACSPFGVDYELEDDTRRELRAQDLKERTLVDICLENPPVEGKTEYDESRTLRIVQELRLKIDGGAQLVVCRLNDDDQDYVAKIYDPIYYDPEDVYHGDVTWYADMEYSREAAAYNQMDRFIGGEYVPKFHGSWTFQIPLRLSTEQKMRDVRMILIERIRGRSMVEFNKNTINESERLLTLGRMAEIIELISWYGVRHELTRPGNVMLCDSEEAGEVGRIVIVGFSGSTVTLLDNAYFRYGTPDPWPDKPANPLDRWFGGIGGRQNCFYENFWEWLPASWDRRLQPLQEWMHDKWIKDDRFTPPWRELRWYDEEARW